jgi:hypothetical protein
MIRWVGSQPHHIHHSSIYCAVGVFDSTSTEIYHSQIEPQKLYFSGNRHFHAIHAQVVIDNASYICYAEARGDAKQFTIN